MHGPEFPTATEGTSVQYGEIQAKYKLPECRDVRRLTGSRLDPFAAHKGKLVRTRLIACAQPASDHASLRASPTYA